MMPKLKYGPGDLLREYSYDTMRKRHDLLGLYLIVSIDEFDANVISIYDKDGYYKPLSRIDISHEDLHKKGKFFKWVIDGAYI
jgi:hypothetical protein|tara:strand:+ start:209 stop:457 length:249 start_codon:yes stop_codon:yes gene_type:complete